MQYEQVTRPAPLSTKRVLGEQGALLPIGTTDPTSGLLDKRLAHKDWTLRTEKLLGRLREENKRETPIRFIALVLSALYEQIGGLVVDTREDPKKKSRPGHSPYDKAGSLISQLWYGDVLYAYVYLRRQIVGKDLPLSITCPRPTCGHREDIIADLDTMEIRSIDNLALAKWRYDLHRPIYIRGEKVSSFILQPPRWLALEALQKAGTHDTGEAKAKMIYYSIDKIPDMEKNIALVEDDLDDLCKFDIEALGSLIDENHIGPDLSIEHTCKKCKNDFKHALDWMYDNFFRVSGPSAAKES